MTYVFIQQRIMSHVRSCSCKYFTPNEKLRIFHKDFLKYFFTCPSADDNRGFGKVWKIQPRNKSIVNSSNMYYALKEMSKVA